MNDSNFDRVYLHKLLEAKCVGARQGVMHTEGW